MTLRTPLAETLSKIEHSLILNVNLGFLCQKKKKVKLLGWISSPAPLFVDFLRSIDCQGLCMICKLLQSFMVHAIKKRWYEHASSRCNAKIYSVPLATICGTYLSLQNTPFSEMNPSVTKIGPLHFQGIGPCMERHVFKPENLILSNSFQTRKKKKKDSNKNWGGKKKKNLKVLYFPTLSYHKEDREEKKKERKLIAKL